MWFFQGMLKLKRTDKVSNTEVLRGTVGEGGCILNILALRQVNIFGHVMRTQKNRKSRDEGENRK